ncbi:MAG: LysR family transcriptional regulator [Deltaproteobacteria bacterium]|nr:LysR family transcriptional regulator [Deltaproteobacteria bacterium]
MDIDLFGLKVFVMVAEKKSFSAAARALYLTQPAITHQVKKLENYFSAPLFRRQSNAVLLTPAGEILYTYAKKFSKLDDELMEEIGRYTGRLTGDLAIGACTMVGEHLVPSLVKSFHETYPEVSFNIEIGNCSSIAEKLLRGTIDVGLIGDEVAHRNVVTESLLEQTLFLVSVPDYVGIERETISLQDLAGMTLLLREEGVGTRVLFEEMVSQRDMKLRDFQIITVAGSNEVIKTMTKEGMGISLFPRTAIERELKRGDLTISSLQEGEMRHTFYLVYRKQKVIPLKIQHFVAFVKGQVGGETNRSSLRGS